MELCLLVAAVALALAAYLAICAARIESNREPWNRRKD